MKTFKILPSIHFGENALGRLKEIPYQRVMVIADPFVVTSGMVDLVTKPLSEGGKEFTVFSDVVPDAPLTKISVGVQEFLSYKPDAIVAVGGGSAIDSSKAIREFALRIERYAEVGLIIIPTTSGTGSEVTSFAVVNDTDAQIKYPLVSDSMTADEAILDVELVKSVPASVTADTGMDVFTHAIEAYVSTDQNDFSAALSEKAMELCCFFLLRSYNDANDLEARSKMHVASCIAGLAFNSASLGINHSMAHQLGARFHIPHGRANAMLLPHVIEFNAGINHLSRTQKEYLPAVEKYARAAHTLGLSSYNPIMGVRSLINWIQILIRELNLPTSISELRTVQYSEYMSAIEEMAKNALNDACTATNPRKPTVEDIMNIYAKLW